LLAGVVFKIKGLRGCELGILFRLKAWLSIEDTAKHLSIVFGEDVTQLDVLRLALDGHLRISVNFVNGTRVRKGLVVDEENAIWGEFPIGTFDDLPNVPESAKGKPITYMKSLNIDDKRFLNLDDEVTTISGIWDLPLVGGERLDLEHQIYMFSNGIEITSQNIDGAFVSKGDTIMCQLQESVDDNEFTAGSKAQLKNIEKKIADEKIDDTKASELRLAHQTSRNKYLEKRKNSPKADDYYPRGGLPEDCIFVVRTEALAEFENNLRRKSESKAEDENVKTLGSRERNNLLKVIAALCKEQNLSLDMPYKAANIVENQIKSIGHSLGSEKIALILSEAEKITKTAKKS
jgi:hypothetical protein